MLSNFIQKPIGIATILGAAVGGPYAAFETDIGTQIRRSLVGQASHMVASNSNVAASGTNTDPVALMAANGTQAIDWNGGSVAPYQPAYQNPGSLPSGQNIPTVYGPATYGPVTVGPATNHPIPMPSPTLETRVGPSATIPGTTHQLWDYTVGTPTLNQIQQQPGASLGGGNVTDLREVLRFDIVPGWLPQRFARVTTVTSNVQMDGIRVPLITGTQSRDIAGTLTYFFDASQSLKRINLHGLTGDPTQLANLMVQYYQLQPEQSLGGRLFTSRWNNRITSVMHVAPAPIIYAGADHSKYILFLELNQPSNQYGLSDEASEILRTSQALQRW